MRGDFSRLRFERRKHYTSVLEQQGRVALDADSNEQRAFDEHFHEIETIDVIGPYGGPQDHPGFEISVSNGAIDIGAGRYYVNGILCENESQVEYGAQPYLIHPAITDSDLLAELGQGAITSIRLFLEVWRRMVTALDDPCLREPALGVADTTTRLQTVWRVVAESTIGKQGQSSKSMPVRSAAAIPQRGVQGTNIPIGNINRPGHTGAGTQGGGGVPQNCCAEMYQLPGPTPRGTLTAQTSGGSSDCSCQPTPAAGYRGLENQLYRVEIHQGGSGQTATFKWSRENGSVVAAVTGISGAVVTVDSVGPDANLGFQAGQWVELSDDTYLFGPQPNQPGELFQIQFVNLEQRTVTMTGPVAQIDPTRNARMTRWEQVGASAGANGVSLQPGSWIELENGIQIQFAGGDFVPGDHWLIPARTATGNIEWPPCGSDGAAFQHPYTMDALRAPLACLHWDNSTQQVVIKDCRKLFPALTEINPQQAASAIHIQKINWANDDLMGLDQLVLNGLEVAVDQKVTGHVDSANFAVVLEVLYRATALTNSVRLDAISGNLQTSSFLQPVLPLRLEVPVDGHVKVTGATVTWRLDPKIDVFLIEAINNLLLAGASQGLYARARVRLLGHTIFAGLGSAQIFLDGQCFGTTGLRADQATPRIDLQFPSGDLERASDFESWFYLLPVVELTSLVLNPAAVELLSWSTPVVSEATLHVSYPPAADTFVDISVTGPQQVPTGFIQFPSTVTVKAGQTSAIFNVTVSPTSIINTFQIVATLPSKIGKTSTVSASLAVKGLTS
jgi:hypothetical protein